MKLDFKFIASLFVAALLAAAGTAFLMTSAGQDHQKVAPTPLEHSP